jgi:hypothetical protein
MKKFIILILLSFLSVYSCFSQISQAEYFFDLDPGFGKGTKINETLDGLMEVQISTEGLEEGFHSLSIRAKNSDGRWSISESRVFMIQSQKEISPIIGYEYFFDSLQAIGDGAIMELTPNSCIEEELLIPFSALVEGTHHLFMRAKDSDGKWSMSVSDTFNVVNNSIPVIDNQTFIIEENSSNGTSLGQIVTSDADNDNISFEILDGNTNSTFSINENGELIVADSTMLDYETNPDFTLEVRITDGIFQAFASIIVNVLNVVETGVAEFLKQNIICYPNPNNGKFHILGHSIHQAMHIIINSIDGSLIYKSSNYEKEIDISNYSNGIYLIKIIDEESIWENKIILKK